LKRLTLLFTCILIPVLAEAHDLVGTTGLKAGIAHPFTGIDHFIAMLSVGILSVLLAGSNIWRIPLTFVLAMIFGGLIGVYNLKFPFLEMGIILSVMALGLAIAFHQKIIPLKIAFIGVLVFGFLHGNAHGVEIPKMVQAIFFINGFIIATIFIHVLGIFVVELFMQIKNSQTWLKIIGLIFFAIGVLLFFKQI
jgi:urease accessory protein